MGVHIAVSGIIGAGKSTLVHGLADDLGLLPLEERFEENPYLRRFYEDPPTWAFRNYVFFLQRTAADYLHARGHQTRAVCRSARLRSTSKSSAASSTRGGTPERGGSGDDHRLDEDRGGGPSTAGQPRPHRDRPARRYQNRRENSSAEEGIEIDYLKDLGDRYEAYLSAGNTR